MHRTFLTAGTLLGATAVALGAFAAHALEKMSTDTDVLQSFKTGVQYQMYHALALLVTGILFERFPLKWTKWAGNFFITGIALFSGSLYAITFLKIGGYKELNWVGPVTPIGGLLLIAGWISLLTGIILQRKR